MGRGGGSPATRRRLLVTVAVTVTALLAGVDGGAQAREPAVAVGGGSWADGCIRTTLRPGDRSRAVRCLEERLAELGYPVDGRRTFGAGTAEAILDAKRRADLPNTPNAGPRILDWLFWRGRQPITTWGGGCIFTTLRQGMSTPQVTCLERRLRWIGYPLDPNGRYGPRTALAVRNMQRRAGIRASGVAGPNTLRYVFHPGRQQITTWAGGCISDHLAIGMSGEPVRCLQRRLTRLNLMSGATGYFGTITRYAVEVMERRSGFPVDGVAGPNTLTAIYAARTPPRIAAGRDELGYSLSPVAVAGNRAPLPPSSGSGRRVVYSRAQQRAWAIATDGHIVRSWRVSGSRYPNERVGTHTVYSKSRYAGAFSGKPLTLPYMIRYYRTPRGNNIGFHAIPVRPDGSRIMSVWQLGQPLSAGCTRQADQDAVFLWDWAPVGTKVVVT